MGLPEYEVKHMSALLGAVECAHDIRWVRRRVSFRDDARNQREMGIIRCRQARRDTMCPAAVAQDPQARNPSVAGALRVTCNGGNPRGPRHLRTVGALRRKVAGNRWGIVRTRRAVGRGRSLSSPATARHGEADFEAVVQQTAATARIAATTNRPAVRSPLSVLRSEKSREALHCRRNCANDRSGLTGDVRRADVFVRPA